MKFKRTTYQFGCLQLKKRKKPRPDVWVLRYRKPQPDGSTKLASQMIGTLEQYPTESQAWKAAEVFRLTANPDNPGQLGVSWGALIDRYLATDLPSRKSTARFYRRFLERHIRPKWARYALSAIKPFAVEEWLKTLKRRDGSGDLAPKTKKHLRGLMHLLYGCAMRWEFVPIGANPFGKRLIRIDDASKVLHKRRSLTLGQFRSLLKHRLLRVEPFRTMVILAICTGLRANELFALRWSDFDWENLTITVQRGVVRGVFDRPKTQRSAGQLPLAAELAGVLWKWKLQSPYNGQTDFVFASPFKGGKAPYWPEGIQKNRLKPAGADIGFVTVSGEIADNLGWNSFRHTYRTLLDESRVPLSAQQELMRHAVPDMTLRYGEAVTLTKRKANLNVVNLILPRRKKARRA